MLAKPPPRVVLDTNVLVSAIIFGGNPREIMELARDKAIQLVTSSEILLELAKKLNEKFAWSQEDIEETIEGIGVFAEIVKPTGRVHKIKADPEDNKILEAAAEADADYIISGDKRHILPLKKFGKTKIVSATQFLENQELPS